MKSESAQAENCYVYVNPQKIMQQMHDIIPFMFDYWANPVAHLLLLKAPWLDILQKCHLQNNACAHTL